METTPQANPTAPPASSFPYFLVGIALFFAGPLLYAIQLARHQLATPWDVPIFSTVGIILMAYSAWQCKARLWYVVLLLFVIVCSFEWFFVIQITKLDPYTGPAAPDNKLPAFSAVLADGTPFTNKNLESGERSVLLFFRGRW